ncbi:MAG: hypothetical protein LH645_07460 [Actinomycetia bacterium]|nr:hypothetical protein [Actinomycetes bacterium]
MTVRRMRGASLGVAGALAAGLVIAPSGGATAADSAGPDFYSVSASSVGSVSATAGSGERAASRPTARVKAARSAAVSTNLQALQVFSGANSIGNNGVTVAAGPKHVMQVGGPTVRILTKNAGKVVKTQQLGQFFKVPGTSFSQGTVVYDPLGKRWIVAAVADDGGEIGLALRASIGTAPTKWQPTVLFASNDSGNPDAVELDPMIGTSNDKIVITTPVTDADTPANVQRIFFFPKGPIFNGNAPDPWTADLNSTYSGQAPAVNASVQNNIFVAVPDTNDATVTTYTGAATTTAPNFSKNVVFPSSPITAPPIVDQGAVGDDLDLGELAFSGVAWRSGKLFAAASSDCSGVACVRLIGVSTEAGVSLIEDEKYKSPTGADWFSPSVAIDRAGYVHTAASAVSESDGNGPSLAVLTLTKISLANPAGAALKARVIALTTAAFNDNGTSGETVDWYGSTGAAIDPTSPWDVWVTGAVGSSTVSPPNLTTSIARVSMAKNKATIKASSTRVNRGNKVTFTCKLVRPDSRDTFRGLPITLQRKGGGKWQTIASGSTNTKGVFKSTQTIRRAGQYRTLGRGVTQVGGEGQSVVKVSSSSISIRLR